MPKKQKEKQTKQEKEVLHGDTIVFAVDKLKAEAERKRIEKESKNKQQITTKKQTTPQHQANTANVQLSTVKESAEKLKADAKKRFRFMQNEFGISYNIMQEALKEYWLEQKFYPENVMIYFEQQPEQAIPKIALACLDNDGNLQRLDNQETIDIPENLSDPHNESGMRFYANDVYNNDVACSDVSKMIGKAVYRVSEIQKLSEMAKGDQKQYSTQEKTMMLLMNLKTHPDHSNPKITQKHLKLMQKVFDKNKGKCTVDEFVDKQNLINDGFSALAQKNRQTQNKMIRQQ